MTYDAVMKRDFFLRCSHYERAAVWCPRHSHALRHPCLWSRLKSFSRLFRSSVLIYTFYVRTWLSTIFSQQQPTTTGSRKSSLAWS